MKLRELNTPKWPQRSRHFTTSKLNDRGNNMDFSSADHESLEADFSKKLRGMRTTQIEKHDL